MAVPTSATELDATWFTRALHESARIQRGRVARVELTPLATQGKASHTYRARLGYEPEEPDAPASAIVKMSLTEPGYLARRFGLGTYRLEVDFYRLLALRLGELVPAVYVAEADDTTGHFVIAMEDLDPARPAGDDLEADLLATAAGIARVHARFWGDERVADVLSRCALMTVR
jgi:hypothetical protein